MIKAYVDNRNASGKEKESLLSQFGDASLPFTATRTLRQRRYDHAETNKTTRVHWQKIPITEDWPIEDYFISLMLC
ncbi:hypothetical protein NDU88_004713 [Pleurodeles waltl]|uniref:Uncharacterized protein n=1 Tax=Pleurodeles waltl TaxID=8319 RepID=A0AAV7QG12_PLEWA|nr:hypothetical protein NDU88_004713 [Pleurodeles waltl]